jgi:nucleoside-diphosphate-sugar epimerase
MRKMVVAITGTNGFIGSALSNTLGASGYSIRRILRASDSNAPGICDDINTAADYWFPPLDDAMVVIHCAALVHVMNGKTLASTQEYRRANFEATLSLARQAAAHGVKRFIFLSSIKVNGEFTRKGKSFSADDSPCPQDPYSVSKHQAEKALLELASSTQMEVVIIRPPLVYGPGVRANFLSMMVWLSRSVPLPLGAIKNYRSLVSIDNLISLIERCICHPDAVNQVFLVSDGEDLSTTDLLYRLGNALGKPARLIPVPVFLLFFFSRFFGYYSQAQRLCSSLQVDITKTRNLLGWAPVIDVDEGLRRAAKDLRAK